MHYLKPVQVFCTVEFFFSLGQDKEIENFISMHSQHLTKEKRFFIYH